jgi:arginyl-tRNA--protein-N-Asp/Glu arginylyltransferase
MSLPEKDLTLDRLIEHLERHPTDPHPCPYLPWRMARLCGFVADEFAPDLYHRLMDRGFRRSGSLIYRPACEGCRECVPLRVPVARFKRSRNQARVWRKNQDLTVSVGPLECTREKWRIYARHLRVRTDGTMSDEFEAFRRFLYESNVRSIEFVYRLGRRIAAVSVTDFCRFSLSSVYAFFDPDLHKRSLGTFSILWEVEYCRRQEIPYYYLGYYVRDCPAMSYKARFRPHQLLGDYRNWEPPDDAGAAPASRP